MARHPRNSDKACNIPLTTKVSQVQLGIIREVLPANQTMSDWLRLAALSAACHVLRERSEGTPP